MMKQKSAIIKLNFYENGDLIASVKIVQTFIILFKVPMVQKYILLYTKKMQRATLDLLKSKVAGAGAPATLPMHRRKDALSFKRINGMNGSLTKRFLLLWKVKKILKNIQHG